MLDSRNIKTIKSNKFLYYKNLNPFKIIRAINNIIYKLELSENISIYPVFYS